MTQKDQTKRPDPAAKPANKRPDETGAIKVEGFIKIFDPVNQEVFVEKQA